MPALVSIVGKSGIGKTTFLEKLVPELKRRGYRVAVVKHHAHTTPIDIPGKDSHRFGQAGADVVVVSSPVETAEFRRVPREKTLAEWAAELDVDLVLTEGFKREPAYKIEVSRSQVATELLSGPPDLIAVVTDHPVVVNVPHFSLDDAPGVATLIERNVLHKII